MKYVLLTLVCLLVAQYTFAENDLDALDLETENLVRELQDLFDDLQTRDSYNTCMARTGNCGNYHGMCKQDMRGLGDFICRCYSGWTGTECTESTTNSANTLKALLKALRED